MIIVDVAQGSDEWRLARLGSLGASRIHEALAETRTGGWGASRASVMSDLIIERLTGVPVDKYVSSAMAYGTEMESEARSAYERHKEIWVAEVGLVKHPEISWTHASPDGLVEDDGLVEIKCPNSATHIEMLLTGKVPDRYIKQMLWQISCCDREYCDFVSYDNRLPESLQLFIKRINRNDAMLEKMKNEVSAFLSELDKKLEFLKTMPIKEESTKQAD